MYDDIDPRNLPSGTVVDGYTLTGRLGGGGMGEIYRAQRGEETFALKLQGERLSAAMDPTKREELEARSRREAAILLSLSHPNILAIIGSGRWPDRAGYLYLITELVQGEPLDVWHERKTPSLRQLARVFERIADALDYMHRAGIYHRDLKDPNVLVRDDATPVVIDLGIARSAAAYTLTRVGAVIGTTTHLSPGICRYLVGEKSRAYRFGPHDDLHALGFMLYERLTGTPPFRLRSDVEWPEFDYYRQVMRHIPPAPRELCPLVPEALSALTLRLLAKTSEDGYQGAAALRDELTRELETAPSFWDEPFPVPRAIQRKDLTRSAPPRLPHPEAAIRGNVDSFEIFEDEAHVRAGASLSNEGKVHSVPRRPTGKTDRAISALSEGTPRPQEAAEALPFVAPTLEQEASFVSPEPLAEGPATPTLQGESLLRSASEQLQLGTRRRRPIGVLGITLLGAALLVAVTLLAKVLAQRPAPASTNLLRHYQEEIAAETREKKLRPEALAPGAAPETPSQTLPASLKTPPTAAPAPHPVATDAVSPPSPADEKAIQSELERAYGTKRPVLPAKASPTPMPSWVKGVEVVDAKPSVAGEKKLGGRYGDHLRLALKSNLDSRLCGSGAVEAALTRPYLVKGQVVLPVRTLAYGQCTAQGARFLITFSRLRMPDGSELQFDGVAMDVLDGKPGLLATRRLGSGAPAQEGLGGSVARGAASTVLGTATAGGGVGMQVAGTAGQTVLNTHSQDGTSSGEDAILLDAGAGIDVFLRQAF